MMESKVTTEWVSVPHKEINKPEEKDQQGVKVKFMLTPTDIPIAWRAFREGENTHHDKLILEFKYLVASEPLRQFEQAQGVTVFLGKNSKRVYRIVVDVNYFSSLPDSHEVNIHVKVGDAAEKTVKDMNRNGELNEGNASALKRFLVGNKFGRNSTLSHVFNG